MRKIITSILLTALLVLCGQARAQIVPGAGYLYSSEVSVSGDSKSDPDVFNGFYVGASYKISLDGGFYVAPGLYANMLLHNESAVKGSSKAGLAVQGTYREVALNVPINLAYMYELNDNVSVMAFAGPVVQFGLISKTTVSGTANVDIFGLKFSYTDGKEVNYYDSEDGSRNRFNVYLGGGVGVQVGDLLFTLGYDHNLLDIDRYDNIKTNRNQIKVGVSFNL